MLLHMVHIHIMYTYFDVCVCDMVYVLYKCLRISTSCLLFFRPQEGAALHEQIWIHPHKSSFWW